MTVSHQSTSTGAAAGWAVAEGPVDVDGLSDLGRMRAITSYDLLEPTLRDRLDAITARTAERLGQPVSLVTVVLDTAQLVIGNSGLEGWIVATGGTPVEWAFCARAVMANAPYVVPDAQVDPVQRHNPLVAFDNVRAYAGVPLRGEDGHVLGAHCVINSEPQQFAPEQVAELEQAAAEITTILREYRLEV